MTEAAEIPGQQRDRSPAFPIIPLETALERLAQFETHFKRSPARAEKVGDAWSIGTKAYADRIAAALRYFGLLEYQGVGKERHVVVSEGGRKYLKAQQEETKREVIRSLALRPKAIAKAWNDWGNDRPADAACIDQLVQKDAFSVAGARDFLKVYDSTISFAKLTESDKTAVVDPAKDDQDDGQESDISKENQNVNRERGQQKAKLMSGERELTTGLLSKDANFRLIVSGPVGVKEIERLIAKLELDKEILGEPDGEPDPLD
jgi:hypothetical protein